MPTCGGGRGVAGALDPMPVDMASAQGKKNRRLKDMLTKTVVAMARDHQAELTPVSAPGGGEIDAPVTCSFLEALFTSLREDLQSFKKELSSNLQEVRCDIDAIGGRSVGMRKLNSFNRKSSDQQIDLQAHTEDLENRSWKNNIHIEEVPTDVEGKDAAAYAKDLFRAILEASPEMDIQLDRSHRVGLPRPD
ncbi:hypothetical protein NDU88_001114 [Pleurodeles waltl]|uniref:Uncharacterized protein n=1 Tax=Pleurodeles waltl TaxID=8319 RepID=A0AAV7VY73_PLEWA|nr:hypothetical protein NDU88_001114 [Pleurodeles waltl]